MKHKLMPIVTIFLTSILLLTVSCATHKAQKTAAVTEPVLSQEDSETEEGELNEFDISGTPFKEVSERDAELADIFQDIRFDYDSFALKPGAKATLDKIASALLNKSEIQVRIEGHCDDRGTTEYNLALGQSRAESAKKYLLQLGISSKRIFTISYGEEKPLDTAQNEEAWSMNRRDHFMIR
jgi:peptidoglycan-associated lipoprotein